MLRKTAVRVNVKKEGSIYGDTTLFQLEWKSTDICMGAVLSV